MKTKKKVFAAFWAYNLPKFEGFICAGWLFRLIIMRSNLDGGMLNLDGETLNLDGGTLNLDGGCVPPRSPYNLSTDYRLLIRLHSCNN